LALRKSSNRITISAARKAAEKKAPRLAKEELKVRFAICVKIFMLISISEK
jgi:hypothetical protein